MNGFLTVVLFSVDILQETGQEVGEPDGGATESLKLLLDAELNVSGQHELVGLFRLTVVYADSLLLSENVQSTKNSNNSYKTITVMI